VGERGAEEDIEGQLSNGDIRNRIINDNTLSANLRVINYDYIGPNSNRRVQYIEEQKNKFLTTSTITDECLICNDENVACYNTCSNGCHSYICKTCLDLSLNTTYLPRCIICRQYHKEL
jgi:hypothetical protein